MNAFIIRPVGEKTVIIKDKNVALDFDVVEAVLIQPALAAADVTGSTTEEILAAGNIRYDMFQLLLTAVSFAVSSCQTLPIPSILEEGL